MSNVQISPDRTDVKSAGERITGQPGKTKSILEVIELYAY